MAICSWNKRRNFKSFLYLRKIRQITYKTKQNRKVNKTLVMIKEQTEKKKTRNGTKKKITEIDPNT